MRRSARTYDVRMAQFVLKIEKLSHIIGARGFQDLRSPSPIMAPVSTRNSTLNTSLRKPIRMQDFIQLCDSLQYPLTLRRTIGVGKGKGKVELDAIPIRFFEIVIRRTAKHPQKHNV